MDYFNTRDLCIFVSGVFFLPMLGFVSAIIIKAFRYILARLAVRRRLNELTKG